MSEDATVVAALEIERYIAGLRTELVLLGSAESDELIYEIRDMLLDAARSDPQRAFSEMERLGEPWKLASTLLAERGITTEGGIPQASWIRLGVAASTDILVGLALPIWALVNTYSSVWNYLSTVHMARFDLLQLGALTVVAALVALAFAFSWRYWAPWRTGSGRATAGMKVAQVSVVTIGGKRMVARTSELVARGLKVSTRSTLSAVTVIAMAAIAIAWSVWMVSTGALDPSGEGAAYRFTGPVSMQETQVMAAVDELYQAAQTQPPELAVWPAIEDVLLDPDKIKESLRAQFTAEQEGVTAGYEAIPSNQAPGMWQVSVTENPGTEAQRDVILTYMLRVDWVAGDESGTSIQVPTWVLSGYDWTP
jgi:uncharacterized membrane protein